jgi:hypothetical protein
MVRFVKGIILLCGFLVLSGPVAVKAATVYLEPAEGDFGPGDSFTADVKIDPDAYCINTVDITVNFPKDYLQVVDFLTGESLINIWLDKPDSSKMTEINGSGKLHFSGGIPGGYCGRIPGDPGVSNILSRIIFQVPQLIVSDTVPDKLEVDFSGDSQVLINDGFGTKDALVTRKAVYNFLREGAGAGGEGWRQQISDDKTPPEPFVVELYANPSMFNGRYYIIFNTSDKQTGIDHYEVLELRPGEEIGVKPESGLLESLLGQTRQAPAWKKAAIPYLLEDQELLSVIKVKAIDKAGNERVIEFTPGAAETPVPREAVRSNNLLPVALGGVMLLVVLSMIWIFVRLYKKIRNYKS